MKPECASTILHVNDVEKSIGYYTHVLGFTVDFRYNDMAGLEYGPVLISLSGPGQEVKKAAGEGSLYIFCDEVDQYFRDIITRGAISYIDIGNRPYGMRDFAIKDPDGNVLSFGKPVPA